ncbi:MAG: mannitol dehydrogenase family protein [Synergistaceae bacterium]|jgi:fructuronate reductase|nr:mannitol dehydrogenase family protein [Synergistaceae bacterium]
MLRLEREYIDDPLKRGEWRDAGIKLPDYDIGEVVLSTVQTPRWLHFGAGSTFRGVIAMLQQQLLDAGETDGGIIAAESFDYDIIDRVCAPYDNISLLVRTPSSGDVRMDVVASVAEAFRTDIHIERLREVFSSPSLQMVSFTITGKGYDLTGINGDLTQDVRHDISSGLWNVRHTISIVTSMMFERFKSGCAPIALVSMDDRARNGEILRDAMLKIAAEWCAGDFVEDDFIEYLKDEDVVSFPCSIIDNITARPSEMTYEMLTDAGIADMSPLITSRGAYAAPFVNAELPLRVVIEDRFPAGRPPLEKAGVCFSDKRTVLDSGFVKLSACFDPVQAALALGCCLLGYGDAAQGMGDPVIRALVMRVGYAEGLPAITASGVFEPEKFLKEAVEERLTNRFLHDDPRRAAEDLSGKMPTCLGVTIKTHMERPDLSTDGMIGIPLVIASWFRYLMGVDDRLTPMPLSGGPMLDEITKSLDGVKVGEPESYRGQLRRFLSNPALFSVDLYEAGLGDRVESLFVQMLAGEGAAARTLKSNLS